MQRQLWLRDPKREVFLFRSPFVFVTDWWIWSRADRSATSHGEVSTSHNRGSCSVLSRDRRRLHPPPLTGLEFQAKQVGTSRLETVGDLILLILKTKSWKRIFRASTVGGFRLVPYTKDLHLYIMDSFFNIEPAYILGSGSHEIQYLFFLDCLQSPCCFHSHLRDEFEKQQTIHTRLLQGACGRRRGLEGRRSYRERRRF
jgi:hypothetical protein